MRSVAARIASRVRSLGGSAYLVTIVSLLTFIRPITHVRLATFRSERIGHFITDTDLALALLNRLRDEDGPRHLYLFVMPDYVCNEQLRLMYMRALRTLPDVRVLDCRTSWLARRIVTPTRLLTSRAQRHRSLVSYFCGSRDPGGIDACGYRGSARPYLSFTGDEEARGWRELRALGLTEGDRFVCLHIRDGAYLRTTLTGRDWAYHDYRNPDPSTYVPVVHRLIARGFVVVRMGRVTDTALPINDPAFIDYANWGGRNDLLDLMLYSHAALAIAGSASGIDQMAFAFGTPTVVTNLIPFDDPRFATPLSVAIPCLLREISTGELIPFSRMMRNRFGASWRYADAGLAPAYNTSEQIWAAVEEALTRIAGEWPDEPSDVELQNRFWHWAESQNVHAQVSEGPWTANYHRAYMGAVFVRENADILLS